MPDLISQHPLLRCFAPADNIQCLLSIIMPVSSEQEQALPRFVKTVEANAAYQDTLHRIADLNELKQIVKSLEPTLTGSALIPYEQATSPPKITIDSGIMAANIPWRLLRCPGGPLVLQMICKNVNFALWIESC
jgi:hypothetical protein